MRLYQQPQQQNEKSTCPLWRHKKTERNLAAIKCHCVTTIASQRKATSFSRQKQERHRKVSNIPHKRTTTQNSADHKFVCAWIKKTSFIRREEQVGVGSLPIVASEWADSLFLEVIRRSKHFLLLKWISTRMKSLAKTKNRTRTSRYRRKPSVCCNQLIHVRQTGTAVIS